jgi:hypothetical protein
LWNDWFVACSLSSKKCESSASINTGSDSQSKRRSKASCWDIVPAVVAQVEGVDITNLYNLSVEVFGLWVASEINAISYVNASEEKRVQGLRHMS